VGGFIWLRIWTNDRIKEKKFLDQLSDQQLKICPAARGYLV
jgi:hypothetical protein